MQPDDSPISLAAMKHLTATDECQFDLSLDGPRLRPVLVDLAVIYLMRVIVTHFLVM